MEPGIYRDYDEATYHREPGLSSTGAKRLLESPAKYRWERDHPIEQTAAMRLGSAIHTSVLGAGQRIEVVEGSRNAKAVKEQIAELEADGAIVLTPRDAAMVEAITDAVQAHRTASNIFAHGEAEVSMCWEDAETGIACRGRIDWLSPIAIVDLKSCQDASRTGFGKAAANLRYDLQAAAYMDGMEQLTGEALPFIFVAVEKEPPYLAVVHQLPDDALERGRRLWSDAKRLYAACVDYDSWPTGEAYPTDEIVTTIWPRWAA